MMYSNLVANFALRTRQNLQTIRSLKAKDEDAEVFEVTQLVNSLLGLLIFPQQQYVDKIPKTPVSELAVQGWPIPKVVGDYPQVSDLRQLVRYLRNAVSHCNLEFAGESEIQALEVWNTDPKQGYKTTWRAKLTVQDLDLIAEKFIQLLIDNKTLPE